MSIIYWRDRFEKGQANVDQIQRLLNVGVITQEEFDAYEWPDELDNALDTWRRNTKVGPLQLRRALRAMGEIETVKTYMETQATEEEQEAWEYATVIPRLNPIVVGLQEILERTDEEVDQLFELALTFP